MSDNVGSETWLKWQFGNTTDIPTRSPIPSPITTTANESESDQDAATLTEAPIELVISVAVGIGVWVIGILLCLLMRCFGSDFMSKWTATDSAEHTMTTIVEHESVRADSLKMTTAAPTASTATLQTALGPTPRVNPKMALASSLEEVVSDSDREDDGEGLEGIETEGRAPITGSGSGSGSAVAGSTAKGSAATLSPGLGHSTSGRMTMVVDEEQSRIEQWIAKREQRDRETVREWLGIIGFGQYFEVFVGNGWGRMHDIERIKGHEELQKIGISDRDHRRELLKAIREYQHSNID